MSSSEYVQVEKPYDGLTFQVRESDRRETMEIIIDRDGSLVLATPADVARSALTQFVEEKLVWVYTKLEEKAAQVQPQRGKEYIAGEGFYYLGRSYRLRPVETEAQRAALRLFQGRFCLRRDALPQAREHFVRWYTLHLRPVLDRLLARLVERVGVAPREVYIRDLGYRWASCNKRRHLYFHWRVAMLPYSAIEYLVAHELVHLIERSHTPAFWERLERVIPDYLERQRWLKEHGGMYDL